MGLQCGIVGMPNVGKSSLFNALTNAKALAANYPFATKEPNMGVIIVPDPRLEELAKLITPQRVVPTSVDILDIAGLIKGASKGEGLGNQFLANIREVDAIIHVVRCFDDGNIVHVEGGVDPCRDKIIIDDELMLKDLETLEKRIERMKKNTKGGNKNAQKELEIGQLIYDHILNSKPARSLKLDGEDLEILKEMQLLTAKPVMYVCNVDDASVESGNAHTEKFKAFVADEPAEIVFISAAIEAEIAELEDPAERTEFALAMGLSEPGVNRVIRSAYKLLDLITYFTAGVKEVRAWTIRRGTLAPGAAGVIHTDFEKGFIRAEVIKYDDYIKFGSEPAVKEAGKMGVEGKEYLVCDGDLMHFRFNV
jgi:ribosome-binding ATPase